MLSCAHLLWLGHPQPGVYMCVCVRVCVCVHVSVQGRGGEREREAGTNCTISLYCFAARSRIKAGTDLVDAEGNGKSLLYSMFQ